MAECPTLNTLAALTASSQAPEEQQRYVVPRWCPTLSKAWSRRQSASLKPADGSLADSIAVGAEAAPMRFRGPTWAAGCSSAEVCTRMSNIGGDLHAGQNGGED